MPPSRFLIFVVPITFKEWFAEDSSFDALYQVGIGPVYGQPLFRKFDGLA